MIQAFNGRHSGMWARPEYTCIRLSGIHGIRVRTTYGVTWLWFTRLTSADPPPRHEYFCTQSNTYSKCTRSGGVRVTTRIAGGR